MTRIEKVIREVSDLYDFYQKISRLKSPKLKKDEGYMSSESVTIRPKVKTTAEHDKAGVPE